MTNAFNLIDAHIKEYKELEEYLTKQHELSFMSTMKVFSLKSILLSIASLYEVEILNLIHSILNTEQDIVLKSFIEKKALERQYHSLFDWDSGNINRFLAFFGSDFSDFAKKKIKENHKLQESAKAFVELGNMRNRLVHLNYLTFPLDWTIEEIADKFAISRSIVSEIPAMFLEYRENQKIDSV